MTYATNEWSQLKQVIVGIAEGARVPNVDISVRTVNYADKSDISDIQVGAYPQQVIEEAHEDLETFCDFLRGESVEVLRPEPTPTGYYHYCPRDVAFVHGDLAMATPMPIQARHNDYRGLLPHIKDLKVPGRCTTEDLYNLECVGDPDTLALTEVAPAFDAANAIRADEHVLYLISNSGNYAGAQLLQEYLGNRAQVHTLAGVYSYMHIDSTVAFLRDGLMLLNPSRIKSVDQLPEPFCKWEVIWCAEPEPIGYYSNYCNASNWINMNLFSVNSQLVALEQHQHSLRKQLEAQGIECAMLPMRHQRTLGGGFHCVTLDTKRC